MHCSPMLFIPEGWDSDSHLAPVSMGIANKKGWLKRNLQYLEDSCFEKSIFSTIDICSSSGYTTSLLGKQGVWLQQRNRLPSDIFSPIVDYGTYFFVSH